jgi:hypothetical protein
MTEQAQEAPRSAYEQAEAAAPGEGGKILRELNQTRADYQKRIEALREDPRYTDEHKGAEAWRLYSQTQAKIGELAPKAKAGFERSAESLERLATPMPVGEGLITKDVDKLGLTSAEYQRISGMLDRQERNTKDPFKVKPAETLERELSEALKHDGPGAGAKARAVHQVARDRQIDLESVYQKHRKPSQVGALEDAQAAYNSLQLVGTRGVKEPPFPNPDKQPRGEIGTYRSKPAVFGTRENKGVIQPRKRRPSWK